MGVFGIGGLWADKTGMAQNKTITVKALHGIEITIAQANAQS
jgi:hypothetical protein